MGMIQSLYASSTGGVESALAAVDVPRDGVIIGVDWAVWANIDADNETYIAELSFGSVSTINSNDVRGRISAVAAGISLTTSGVAAIQINKYVGPVSISVAGGERLYINVSATAGVTSGVHCMVHYSFDEPRARVRRS